MGNKSLFPVVAVPPAFFGTFFRFERKYYPPRGDSPTVRAGVGASIPRRGFSDGRLISDRHKQGAFRSPPAPLQIIVAATNSFRQKKTSVDTPKNFPQNKPFQPALLCALHFLFPITQNGRAKSAANGLFFFKRNAQMIIFFRRILENPLQPGQIFLHLPLAAVRQHHDQR